MMWYIVIFVLIIKFGSTLNPESDVSNNMAQSGLSRELSVLENDADNNDTSNSTEIRNDNTGNDCYSSIHEICPAGLPCQHLDADCLNCSMDTHCQYGAVLDVKCRPKHLVNCTGNQEVSRKYHCRYCYQLERWQYECNASTSCSLNKPRNFYPARPFYTAVCKPYGSEYCLGRRCFYRQMPCNWSRGYKWSTALILSITLGGFGVDRFYLGLWREGIGKLFSFGGLGVWTLVDVILIAVGYIGPSDGSLYI